MNITRYGFLLCFVVVILILILNPALAISSFADKETLIFSWSGNVGPLNPHLYSPNQMFAQAMVYEPLIRYGEGGRILPWLADKWKISSDGKTYMFTLRKDVMFSDGTPFNASAVKKNFDAILANARRHAWLEFIKQIEETAVVDPYTFKLVLKNSYYPTLQELALIRPVRFLGPSAIPVSGNTAEGIKAPIGTGPWMLVETKLGEYDRFTRNDRYWGQKPNVKDLLVKVVSDPNTRAIAFETGQIDLIYGGDQISLDTFNRFRSSKRYVTQISQPLSTRILALNSNRGPTKSLAVRKAILYAVNKAAIIKGIFLDTERQAETLFSENLPYCNLNLRAFPHDPSRAEQLLDEAGWRRVQGQPFRTRDGLILETDLCFVGNSVLQKAIAEVIQGDLRKVGIKANLVGEEQDSFLKRQREGEFGMIFGDTWGASYDPHSFVSSMRVPSHADYQAQLGLPMKAEIDAKISEVLITIDEGKRKRLYHDILSTLHEQAVYLPISFQSSLIVHRENLTGVSFGPTKYEIPFEHMEKRE